MDRFAGQAEVGNRGEGVPLWNTLLVLVRPELCYIAPLLRGVVFIREPALGLRLDLEGVGLRPVSGRDQLINLPV
ncbi:hypothetical protein MKK75_08735 [Methylobacterium sp. J-030]|uniref:hypothetical protein n=1 Tax=Methylobacterium sp. J-030 TaxID=2836627 RepID=UPI001FB99E1F|nr:hypothetical protein [Methylobacterium sp. J-030]MCJ2068885.1 hypothetical protein [Methylobacterium sp. J-030]